MSVRVDIDELESMLAAAYAGMLPIPPWWPAAERAAFITEHAGYAAFTLLSDLDNVLDDTVDWAARHQIGNDDRSAMINARQHALLDDALTVGWDLTEVIAERSAELMAEAVFTRHRPARRVWPPIRRRRI